MPTPFASELLPLARAARRTELRLRTAEASRSLLLGLIPTLTLSAGLVLQIKLSHGAHGPARTTLFVLVGAAATVTIAFVARAYARRYPRNAGAIRLDTTFDLHDRVTSALTFAALPDQDRTPLMDAAIEDAIAQRAKLIPSKAAPILPAFLSPDFAAVVGLAAMVFGLTLLQWSTRTVIPQAATIDAISLTADDLDLFRETLEELSQKDPSPETKEALQQFNQLVEDLAQKRLDRAEAFRRMDSLEKGLLKGRDADAKSMEEALKNAAEKLKDSPLSKPAGEALAKKDFEKAKEELKKLAEKLRDKQNKISEADKKRLKDALANAAKSQKEILAKLNEARDAMRASLLQREQKAG